MRKLFCVFASAFLLTSCSSSFWQGMAAASQQQSMYSNFWNNASLNNSSNYSAGNSNVRTSRKQVQCPTCGGEGFKASKLTASGKIRCGSCSGKGYVIRYE